jgi:hypothetical protein
LFRETLLKLVDGRATPRWETTETISLVLCKHPRAADPATRNAGLNEAELAEHVAAVATLPDLTPFWEFRDPTEPPRPNALDSGGRRPLELLRETISNLGTGVSPATAALWRVTDISCSICDDETACQPTAHCPADNQELIATIRKLTSVKTIWRP